jgi:aldehyde dehydrogenase (NAD+)
MTNVDVELLQSVSPHDGELLRETRPTRAEDVEGAAVAARRAGRHWASLADTARADALARCANALERGAAALAQLVSREVGKPIIEAEGEVARGVAILRYHAQTALMSTGEVFGGPGGGALSYAVRRPRGVAGLITPWNFPVAIPLWKAAPALASGNAVLLKPAPQATATALAVRELLDDCLPDDLLQVLPGGADTGAALVESVDVVSFTGSTLVGGHVRRLAAEQAVPLQSELGGQNASLVLAYADLERAAATIAGSAMSFAGQKCTATRRVIVLGDHLAFAKRLQHEVRRLQVGDPADRATVVGPVIDQTAVVRVRRAVEDAVAAGGRLLGSAVPERRGNYLEPSVLVGVDSGPMVEQEVFGPAVTVHGAASVAEAMAKANDAESGLVAAVFTDDLGQVLDAVSELEVGLVRINAPTTGLDIQVPFGGTKGSSYGPAEQGMVAREFYTQWQTVLVQS